MRTYVSSELGVTLARFESGRLQCALGRRHCGRLPATILRHGWVRRLCVCRAVVARESLSVILAFWTLILSLMRQDVWRFALEMPPKVARQPQLFVRFGRCKHSVIDQ